MKGQKSKVQNELEVPIKVTIEEKNSKKVLN